MDPWWNPAVEYQASDRAHRIGQERPVTIYRLVAKDTIEERILKLHATKAIIRKDSTQRRRRVDKAHRPGPPTGHGAAARRLHHATRRMGWWMRFAYPPYW